MLSPSCAHRPASLLHAEVAAAPRCHLSSLLVAVSGFDARR